MRKLIYGINLTLDGCCDHTKGVADSETHEYWTDFLRLGDLLVYGRKTYELMVPFWPEVAKTQSMDQASNDFARVFDSLDRVVFSRTLAQPEDRKTRIVHADLRDEILRLKQEPGTNILTGGVNLPSQLVELDLIDEYRIVVGSVIAGAGRRLFDDVNLAESARLKLVETRTFKSGCVALHYLRS
jgi:dihydrofolate reductase